MSTPTKQCRVTEDLFLPQQRVNNRIERGALGLTLDIGESVEFTNGVTLIIRQKKGRRVTVIILAPQNVRAYRDRNFVEVAE